MTQDYSDVDFLPLKVLSARQDGKRRFDKEDKQKLIEVCLQPGVSVAGMALKAGVNANLLRRWIDDQQQKHYRGTQARQVSGEGAAFVPMVEIAQSKVQAQRAQLPPHREGTGIARYSGAPSQLTVEMPNGITLRLECAGEDATLVSAMIETLGRYDVPVRR